MIKVADLNSGKINLKIYNLSQKDVVKSIILGMKKT